MECLKPEEVNGRSVQFFSSLKVFCIFASKWPESTQPPQKKHKSATPMARESNRREAPMGCAVFLVFECFFFAFLLPSGVQFCFFDFWRCLKVFCIYCLLMFYFWGFNQQIEGFKASKKRTTFKKRAFQASATINKMNTINS